MSQMPESSVNEGERLGASSHTREEYKTGCPDGAFCEAGTPTNTTF